MTAPVATLDSFPLFSRLPPEIRIKIWEDTWPEPRVIELAYAEEPVYDAEEGDDSSGSNDGLFDRVGLRLTCGVARWLQTKFDSRIMEDQPLEKCLDPIALQVCHESRAHTIRHFTTIQHSKLDTWPFYFNRRSDILWLNTDVTDELTTLDGLRDYYGRQLDQIERVFVLQSEWEFLEGYAPDVLDVFGGLRLVQILLDDPDLLTREEYFQTANRLRTKDIHELSKWDWTVQYVDFQVNVYGQFRTR